MGLSDFRDHNIIVWLKYSIKPNKYWINVIGFKKKSIIACAQHI